MSAHGIIENYFPVLDPVMLDRFRQLGELYAFWNARINVISRKDFSFFYTRHVLHSLAIAKVISFRQGTQIMDLGTGGGFPGIPLAILFPDSSFYLVDSIGKKIRVVSEIVAALQLENTVAEQIRAEQVERKFHFIISRAVTRLPDFVRWTADRILPHSFNELTNGILYLKGGDVNEELQQVQGFRNQVFSIADFFDEDYFITKKLIHLYR